MTVNPENFKIEMTYDEVWDIYFDIYHALNFTLKTHWISYQKAWMENEKKRLSRLKTFATALGRPEMYDNIFTEAEEIFKKYNQTQITK